MAIGTVYLRPSRLAYVRATGPYEDSVIQAWEHMLTWLKRNDLLTNIKQGYGMMRDNPLTVAAGKCRYDACVDLNPLFEERAIRELSAQTLPGGSYVRLRKSGDNNALRAEMAGYYSSFQAPPGLRLEDRRPIVAIYFGDPLHIPTGILKADLCVPVSAYPKRGADDGLQAA